MLVVDVLVGVVLAPQLLLGLLGRDGLGLVVALWDLLGLLEVTGDSRGQLGDGVVGLALS